MGSERSRWTVNGGQDWWSRQTPEMLEWGKKSASEQNRGRTDTMPLVFGQSARQDASECQIQNLWELGVFVSLAIKTRSSGCDLSGLISDFPSRIR